MFLCITCLLYICSRFTLSTSIQHIRPQNAMLRIMFAILNHTLHTKSTVKRHNIVTKYLLSRGTFLYKKFKESSYNISDEKSNAMRTLYTAW